MVQRFPWLQALALAALFAAGCGVRAVKVTAPSPAPATADGSKFLLPEAPPGAKGVLDVRKEAKEGDEVVVIGKVGGSKKPIIKDRAAFTIVDPSLKSCDEIPGDECPCPWDYCCAPNLAQATVMIKFVDEEGKTLAADPRQLLGIKELQTVIIRGKARRDDAGNLTIHASGLHVKS
jgi:hypothetical protein